MSLSILIPIYNYDIQLLIKSLLFQLKEIDFKWEILLSDDASNQDIKNKNKEFIESINKFNVKLFYQKKNIGNAGNRNYLINYAQYDWILFLDADVLPVNDNFIKKYITQIQNTDKEIIAGNIIYDQNNPLPHLLRWKYGKSKEEVGLFERQKHPIIHLRGANFAIKKKLILHNNFPILKEKYGFVDTRFFLQFHKNQVNVIENPVYHLGIESNEVFLKKTKSAIKNALFLMKTNDKLANKISLISGYKNIRISRYFLAMLFDKIKLILERKIVSEKPSVTAFQVYKVLYLSYLDIFKSVD